MDKEKVDATPVCFGDSCPIWVDYIVAKECKHENDLCEKCGDCGRVFNEQGIMTDEGGTTCEEI